MRRKMDNYFKDKLNQPQQAPADAWDNIQARLPKEERKPLIPLWGRIGGIAALALVLVGGAYTLTTNQDPTSSIESGLTNSPISTEQSTNQTNTDSNKENNTHSIQSEINNQSQIASQNARINLSNSVINSNQINSNHSYEYTFTSNNDLNNSFNTGAQPYVQNNPIENIVDVQKKINPKFNWDFISQLAEAKNTIASNENTEQEFLLEPKLENEEKTKVKKNKSIDFNRFSVSGFVSPMALNTFVGSSMLSDEMSDFKTENNITLAYGLKGAYALSQNVKIRTGVSMIGFEQFTRNVPLTSSLSASSLPNSSMTASNINYNSQLRVINAQLESILGTELSQSTIGDMQQQSQYIEIPVEAEVSLFENESIGISATGGGSTWLLSKNKIYVHSDNYTEELGRAKNLSKASFSANAGLKFDLKISEDVQFNVEPHFKYLINTVNNIDKYNPYTVGVNAGVTVNLK